MAVNTVEPPTGPKPWKVLVDTAGTPETKLELSGVEGAEIVEFARCDGLRAGLHTGFVSISVADLLEAANRVRLLSGHKARRTRKRPKDQRDPPNSGKLTAGRVLPPEGINNPPKRGRGAG